MTQQAAAFTAAMLALVNAGKAPAMFCEDRSWLVDCQLVAEHAPDGPAIVAAWLQQFTVAEVTRLAVDSGSRADIAPLLKLRSGV